MDGCLEELLLLDVVEGVEQRVLCVGGEEP
jgi:hypothetical protein